MWSLWPGARGTSVAQSLSRLRQAFTGSLRFRAQQNDFDKRISGLQAPGSLALSRGAARREGRERNLAWRGLDTAVASQKIRQARQGSRALHKRRIAEPDAEF